jgi:hypothetical protein
MKILSLSIEPVATIPYATAASGGGRLETELPILKGKVDRLPEGLDALIITSDLQGIGWLPAGPVLLGEKVADELVFYVSAAKAGVLLAGDLYSAPEANMRGATGDVRSVWQAFARNFRWVVGVAGNHDLFGSPHEQAALRSLKNLFLLDGAQAVLDGLKIGGVSGILGKPTKANRKDLNGFKSALEKAGRRADILVLHEPPAEAGRIGKQEVRDALIELGFEGLVCCGHAHWKEPLAAIQGMQVLNVDSRVVVLENP